MGDRRVRNRAADALEQPRSLQNLLRERHGGGIVTAQQREPLTRVAERYAREEVQVVVHDRRGDRLARHVDQVGARPAQQHQQAQQPLLVMAHAADLRQLLGVKGEARNNHDGLEGARIRECPAEQRRQPSLQLLEAPTLLLGGGGWRIPVDWACSG